MQHLKQQKPWGCMYYAVAMLTDNESLLEYQDDMDEAILAIRMFHLGYLTEVIFFDGFSGASLDPSRWLRFFYNCARREIYTLDFVITFASGESRFHNVAVRWTRGYYEGELVSAEVVVSDSLLDAPLFFNEGEFIMSKYAIAKKVTYYRSSDLDLYKIWYGNDALAGIPNPN